MACKKLPIYASLYSVYVANYLPSVSYHNCISSGTYTLMSTNTLSTHSSSNLISRLLAREKRICFLQMESRFTIKPQFTCSKNWSALWLNFASTLFSFHRIFVERKGPLCGHSSNEKYRRGRDVCQHCGIISVENVKGKEWAIKAPTFLSFFILTMKEQSSLSVSQSVEVELLPG